ncbi:hypothetical protein AAG570_006655 [Ranatra chinensis]|uniref:EF-hand domain-containing protein n=1 Tax=Ranatra chinensis TaxID=642074 RepID=A0ABD0Z575_9HEMI
MGITPLRRIIAESNFSSAYVVCSGFENIPIEEELEYFQKLFEPKDLEDWPRQREEEMRADAAEQARLANERRIAEEIQSRMTLGDVLKEIRTKTEQREICLKPTAARLDRKKNGHLTEDDMREVFIEHCIFPTERQYRILWNAYKDETGFVYKTFFEDLKNVDYKSPEVIAAAKMKAEKEKQQIEQERQLLDEQETNIVEILGKIKRKFLPDTKFSGDCVFKIFTKFAVGQIVGGFGVGTIQSGPDDNAFLLVGGPNEDGAGIHSGGIEGYVTRKNVFDEEESEDGG